MNDPKLSPLVPHDAAEELLPWYATGQLEERDRARVERHLLDCGECREQLAVERRLIDEFQSMTPEMESGWARLRNRIEPPRPAPRVTPQVPVGFWASLSRPAVAGLAMAQLAFVLVSAGLLLSLSRPAYHTLGSAPEPASANVILMFRDDVTESDMRQILEGSDASIVGGPTPAGAYLLHVEPRQRADALARLQADHDVQLAQPLDGSAP
jgi:anti-sigma-K factor RskA